MHKPESVQENEMQKIILDFQIRTDHQKGKTSDNLKKRTCWIVYFAVPANDS